MPCKLQKYRQLAKYLTLPKKKLKAQMHGALKLKKFHLKMGFVD
jgi:hypothetical protein